MSDGLLCDGAQVHALLRRCTSLRRTHSYLVSHPPMLEVGTQAATTHRCPVLCAEVHFGQLFQAEEPAWVQWVPGCLVRLRGSRNRHVRHAARRVCASRPPHLRDLLCSSFGRVLGHPEAGALQLLLGVDLSAGDELPTQLRDGFLAGGIRTETRMEPGTARSGAVAEAQRAGPCTHTLDSSSNFCSRWLVSRSPSVSSAPLARNTSALAVSVLAAINSCSGDVAL